MIELRDLSVSVVTASGDEKPVINNLSLIVPDGELHAIMGPNGHGKSTLGMVIAGHPRYKVTKGDILLDGKSILNLSPEERAMKGLFVALQHPVEVTGVGLGHFLFTAFKKHNPSATAADFRKQLNSALFVLDLTMDFTQRQLNVGMSGGEKKRAEILQMLILKPRIVVIDEIDSGLDIDSLIIVAKAIQALRSPPFCGLLITHYSRILTYVSPDAVHVLMDGHISTSGGPDLPQRLEKEGYAWLKEPA